MNDKIKAIIGFVLIILAIISYLASSLYQTLETATTRALLIFVAMISGLAGLFILWRYLPRIL